MYRARKTDPETSHEAARSRQVSRVEMEIFLTLSRPEHVEDGLTTLEMEGIVPYPRVTVSPAMKPMEQLGMAYRAGTRVGSTGRRSTIWKANLKYGS